MEARIGQQIRAQLEAVYGSRLEGIILYGSEARGEAGPDSDIDILVVLRGPVRLWQDICTCLQALLPLGLALGRPISPKPVDADAFRQTSWPLYENAKREGVRI